MSTDQQPEPPRPGNEAFRYFRISEDGEIVLEPGGVPILDDGPAPEENAPDAPAAPESPDRRSLLTLFTIRSLLVPA